VSLKARLNKISRELCFGELFDGATMEELSAHVFGGASARPGVRRAETFIELSNIPYTLRGPERLRHELAETEAADVFRKERGWAVAVTPDRRREWEERITEAEQEAAETRAEYGIADDSTREEIQLLLLDMGAEAGLTAKEMKSLRQAIGADSGGW
jgi:hypothetical protein